jgi:hypothetical protein
MVMVVMVVVRGYYRRGISAGSSRMGPIADPSIPRTSSLGRSPAASSVEKPPSTYERSRGCSVAWILCERRIRDTFVQSAERSYCHSLCAQYNRGFGVMYSNTLTSRHPPDRTAPRTAS